MQPRYITLTSSTTTAWQLVNWQQTLQQQISFAVINSGTSASSWAINVTFESPDNAQYPSPAAGLNLPSTTYQANLTSFQLATGSSTQFITVGSSMAPIAGWQGLCNASTGAKLTFVVNQAGIG